MENNLRLIKLFQNEQGTLLNKVRHSTADYSISPNYYLPTLISAPFNLTDIPPYVLTIFTSATGSTRPRSTRHQGLLSARVCVHLLRSGLLFPSTALRAGFEPLNVLDCLVGWKRAILL